MHFAINGIEVESQGICEQEAKAYVKRAPKGTYAMTLIADGEDVEISYEFRDRVPFERIRRITGYLVGTLDRFNDGKRAEERDRVKHTI